MSLKTFFYLFHCTITFWIWNDFPIYLHCQRLKDLFQQRVFPRWYILYIFISTYWIARWFIPLYCILRTYGALLYTLVWKLSSSAVLINVLEFLCETKLYRINYTNVALTGLAKTQGHLETLYPPTCSYFSLPIHVVVFFLLFYLYIIFNSCCTSRQLDFPCVEHTCTVLAKHSALVISRSELWL